MSYETFLESKLQFGTDSGFDPIWLPEFLKGFQTYLVDWALRKGRAAILADCGMGKTPMQLVWAQNVVEKTNSPVLILTPLAVSHQTVREGEKFGIECERSSDGKFNGKIVVANYERLHKFDSNDFAGCVCDESSILKNFDGKRKAEITEFMRRLPYRLLCTATAAPNDFDELGTSSEAIGYLGYHDMLTKFFTQKERDGVFGWGRAKYRLKGHAEIPFWRWVCSWARAIRRPSDFGFEDGEFTLPALSVDQHVVPCSVPRDGMLFVMPASNLQEERQERRLTLEGRCERVAELTDGKPTSVAWCHLNDEGDLLEKLIPDAPIQVSGKDSDDAKEEKLTAFSTGQARVLVTKPKISGWGMNWQHCSHTTMFPSHSFEQYYQVVRRFWRFGQVNEVQVDMVTTPGEESVLANLQEKAAAADVMFDALIEHSQNALNIRRDAEYTQPMTIPEWI